MTQSIAIIGGGPAGCALACFLVARSIDCIIFDEGNKPHLLVGESLIPAAIPLIRRLGIEQEVAQFSVVKKGAGMRHRSGAPRVDFEFRDLGNDVPDYAYNIPRPLFDQALRNRAKALGVRFVSHKAEVELTTDPTRELQLSDDSLLAANLNRATQPDLLIDASGRKRLFSRKLKLGATRGSRNDVAHFAHYKNFPCDSALPGQVVISALECGWSWQIPLKDCTSVGVVLDAKAAQSYGTSAAQRLDAVIQSNTLLNKPGRALCSEVMTYSNYQLIADKGFGDGWVLLGDAFGFVDPMLSPGVFMALESASELDRLVFSKTLSSQAQRERQFAEYSKSVRNWHQSWTTLIDYFYDGRLLALAARRPEPQDQGAGFSIRKIPDQLVSGVLSKLVSGAGTRSKLNQGVLSLLCRALVTDPEMIRSSSIKDDRSFTQNKQPPDLAKNPNRHEDGIAA